MLAPSCKRNDWNFSAYPESDRRGDFLGVKSRDCPNLFETALLGRFMTDVSIVGAVLAGLVSFLSPCVLPLGPGYVSMLSGIGMEQLRQGQQPKGSLFLGALSVVVGFLVVFVSFWGFARAVRAVLHGDPVPLGPTAGALIIFF